MRRGFGQALRIGVAPGGVALVKTSRWQRARGAVLAERGAGEHNAAGALLRELLEEAAPAGWPVTLVLSDELVRMWQVTPPAAATRKADLEAAAALRFQALFGAAASGWKITADWSATSPFLAAAVPAPLLAQIEQLAAAHRFHLVEVVPQFVAAMNQWRKARRRDAWSGLLHDGVLTVALYDAGALVAVRAAPVPAGAGRDWLDGFVAREALRTGLPHPERLQLCGAVPAEWGGGDGSFSCSLLQDASDGEQSAFVRLALTGSAA